MDTSSNPLVNINNKFLLKGLFYEETLADKSTVLWTLKEQDYKGYPSLYRLYMEANDLTEYKFIKKHFGSMAHWEALCQCKWFAPLIEAWRKELELKVRSEALANIQREAKTSSKNSFSANKFLIDKGWVENKQERKVGRTSKEEIKRQALELHQLDKDITADLERISA